MLYTAQAWLSVGRAGAAGQHGASYASGPPSATSAHSHSASRPGQCPLPTSHCVLREFCSTALQRGCASWSLRGAHSATAHVLPLAAAASTYLRPPILAQGYALLQHAKQGCGAAEHEASASGSLTAAEGLPAPEEISAVMASPAQRHLPAPAQGQAASRAPSG